MKKHYLVSMSDEALDILERLSPTECEMLEGLITPLGNGMALVSNRGALERIFEKWGVHMWTKTDGAGSMGPFEASSVVSLTCALDTILDVFDRDMTLGEIEGVLYECLSEVVACPTCKGVGRFAHDIYCNRCAGTGYLYLQEC